MLLSNKENKELVTIGTKTLKATARRCLRIATLPVVLILLLLAKSVLPGRRVRIVVMDPRFFGHQSLEPEVFWNDMLTAKESGSKDIWLCCLGKKSMATNPFLWKTVHRRLPTVPSWLTTDLEYWQDRIRLDYVSFLPASIYRLNFLTKREPLLPKTPEMVARREKILSELSEPTRDYVVFTIRASHVSYDPCDPRNRKISDFEPAMNELTRRGFNVVRVMSRTTEHLITDNKHILDWDVHSDGEPGDELALLSGSKFVVSTTTGGDCLALAYRKPVLYIDSARPYLVFLATEFSTFQIPRMVDVITGSDLSLKDLLERRLGWVGEPRHFEMAGVRIINSSSDEVSSYVVEYLDYLTSGPSREHSALDDEWRRLLMEYHGDEILMRHGEIRSRMLPSSQSMFIRN